jgi:hypothetical protein
LLTESVLFGVGSSPLTGSPRGGGAEENILARRVMQLREDMYHTLRALAARTEGR